MRRAGVEPAQPEGGCFTDSEARQCPADACCPVARVGIEPTNDHQGLSLVALPVCVPCQEASPMGFEPMTSTVTGWRALQAAPRGQIPVAQVGVEPTASLVLSEGGLPIAYRARHPVPGAGVEPTSAGSEPDVLPVRRPRKIVLRGCCRINHPPSTLLRAGAAPQGRNLGNRVQLH